MRVDSKRNAWCRRDAYDSCPLNEENRLNWLCCFVVIQSLNERELWNLVLPAFGGINAI